MKRHKQLFDEICSFENLVRAARKAQRGKRFVAATALFNHQLERELLRLQDELVTQTYRPGPYNEFYINDPKRRLIRAAPYRDRVVHHALCNVIEPIFDRTFIHDSYSCRAAKGTHAAADRLQVFMQTNTHALKCDISKYFPSIDHQILKELLRRKIACPRALWLVDLIIDHSNPQEEVSAYFVGDHLFTPQERRRGIPIGNQTSQFFSNVYLDALDHFVKQSLGCRRYLRYVDDVVVLEKDKQRLWEIRDACADFLNRHLRLRLHPKKQWVFPVSEGVDFVGYRVWPTHSRLRRSSGVRFARRLRWMQEQYGRSDITLEKIGHRIASWNGHACHADTYGLRSALLENAVFSRA
ncbi:MAG: hypothetical protein AUJ92_08415 [Armatimonadetes bacterium CG2_30_59_28]|nr:RNA-dependent DNA polymerase [Armatimonadota bacterium]OIO95181.1 MAG: hypothetical protein AUJ92_08415 [Armatimonadetes bacterium CG2_30_59_28]PIU66328.1 MAG: RNA-dependent DNA polymerase [Armatimonadetes bacterium CG07_land_8_20_14_0_80_59_28]PIX40210.1 MAG: RNA-dependent DNA polymerase [Armatimonadetes bacterium CG_4_8_14_3_um_filter_58_9]